MLEHKRALLRSITTIGIIGLIIAKNIANRTVTYIPAYLAIDYVYRCILIALCYLVIKLNGCTYKQAKVRTASLYCIAQDTLLYLALSGLVLTADLIVNSDFFSNVYTGHFLLPKYPLLYRLDISFGILLISVSEELCFRGVLAG